MHAPLPKLPVKMPVERSRSRRERRSASARLPVLHVVAPGLEVARETPRKGETITAFLRRTGWAARDPKYGWQFRKRLPTILEVNGEPVLRKDWRRTKIAANDNVRFVSFPRGGNGKQGKQVLGLVALIAVAAFAGWAGPALAGGLGLTGTAATITGGLLTGAIGLGGALLVNALVAPKQGATNDSGPTDQIYTASAAGNRARLGQPLPVWYGRNKDYPDFAATPWGEFIGNDQYLNVLLSVSMGSMEYEQLTISDTPFWNPVDGVLPAFSSAQVAFYEPGEKVTLFPINVAQSEEVNGQQLPHDYGWIGPYVANAPGTQAYQIALDFVFPAGCYSTNDEGQTVPFGVTLVAEAQPVNDAGTPAGDWSVIGVASRSYASRSPIRETMLATMGHGRYQVRFRRTSAVPADNKGAAEVVWAGLRSYLVGDNSFPDVSTIAIRIKATESTQGSFKFGVIGTRKLPVWDTDTGTFITQATRSPSWALLDMATNTQYGAEVQPSKVDFNTLFNHATNCAARGDTFDYVFKSAVAVPEAFDTALTVARTRHMWLGDTLSLVRDEWGTVPAMMLTDREIVRDSTSFEYTMLGEEDPDAVILEYIDENTWLPATVQYPPNSETFTASRPETKRINGIQNRDHAYRETAFYYLCSIYRREAGSIGCEYEGRAITMGANLRLQSELPQDYGYAGAVTDRDGLILTLDPAPIWATGEQHYIRLRRPNGKEFGPIKVTRGLNDGLAVLDSDDLETVEGQQNISLTDVLARADGGEYPTYALGTAGNQAKQVKVLTGQPNGETFTLSIVVDDERVHATEIGTPPILPTAQFPENSRAPSVAFLQATFRQGIAEPILDATWWPAPGARFYTAEVSYDARTVGNDDASWIKIYEGTENKFSQVVDRADLRLRVQATAERSGARSFVDVDAPTIVIAPGTVDPSSMEQGLRDAVTTRNSEALDNLAKQIQILASSASDQDAQQALDRLYTRILLQKQGVTIKETARIIEDVDGRVSGMVSLLIDNNGYVSGTIQNNDGTESSFTVLASEFFVVAPGVGDGEPIPLFLVQEVDGQAAVTINGDVLADGSITARALNVATLSAITADAGTVTAGIIQSANGKYINNLTTGQELWSD
ncbi:host specificity factor TipJ family phage tail protein [Afipia carboxidovorans]|uniref:host specificity factor TipJ family phage tail protein n=1 Tax=Afipia carboxidovorans TaxID=40137 RepID=UPI0030D1BC92